MREASRTLCEFVTSPTTGSSHRIEVSGSRTHASATCLASPGQRAAALVAFATVAITSTGRWCIVSSSRLVPCRPNGVSNRGWLLDLGERHYLVKDTILSPTTRTPSETYASPRSLRAASRQGSGTKPSPCRAEADIPLIDLPELCQAPFPWTDAVIPDVTQQHQRSLAGQIRRVPILEKRPLQDGKQPLSGAGRGDDVSPCIHCSPET